MSKYTERERKRERNGAVVLGVAHLPRLSIINDQPSLASAIIKHRRSASLPNPPPREKSEIGSEGLDVTASECNEANWISWFCDLRGNEFFCEVEEDYIRDDFNLNGLSSQVPYYEHALDVILDLDYPHEDMFTKEQIELIESAVEVLYGLIHARYILTTKGMAAMLDKYYNFEFGICPRVYCSGQPCLPVGESDIARSSTVKIYCPRCEDIYEPHAKYQDIDGAYFGTTFPHLLLMSCGDLKPEKPSQSYVPRVFGFKVHKP